MRKLQTGGEDISICRQTCWGMSVLQASCLTQQASKIVHVHHLDGAQFGNALLSFHS